MYTLYSTQSHTLLHSKTQEIKYVNNVKLRFKLERDKKKNIQEEFVCFRI